MSTLADYTGRTVDVLALRGQDPEATVVLSQSLFDTVSSGEICTGVQKLVQRWTLEFLTELGSMPFLPERGCRFMTAARQGRLRTEADVIAEFRFAADTVRQHLVAEESDAMPDDERLDSATMAQILLTEDGELGLSVTILSLAGTSRSVILPVAVSTLSTPL